MNKPPFLYEIHMHTAEASRCGRGSGVDMARAHAQAGYSGMFVTDHFFNGNSTVPRNRPWSQRIDAFCLGWERAREEGERWGLSVFLGWEWTYRGADFLTWGLDKEFLHDHVDLDLLTIEEYAALVHEAGGVLCHAHPFRAAEWLPEPRVYPELVDAVEVRNASHRDPAFDRRALEFAQAHGLPGLCGSDSHSPDPLNGGGMAFDRRFDDAQELIRALLAGEGRLWTSPSP